MKKRSNANIDGFVVRRRDNNKNSQRPGVDNFKVPERFLEKPAETPDDKNELPDISELSDDSRFNNLAEPAQPEEDDKKRGLLGRLFGRGRKARRERKIPGAQNKKKWIKRSLLILAGLLLAVGIFLGVKAFLASQSVFDGNLFGLFSEKRLQTDQYGRTNVLVFGTSEDSPAHQATGEGPDLTDSMMILSVDQDKKDAFMLSIPRDLWVTYDRACLSGYEGKINVAYQCAKDQEGGQQAGAEFLEGIIERDFGVSVQYYVQVNYTVLKESVDAVGGITVEIDSDDPRGILDRNFDWKCNYTCYYVKWPNGPAKLDGEHALALARARNAAGGYGLGGGNFDREKYQQKIMVALKKKAVSAGTLTNPVRVTKLIDSLGKNVRTNFDTAEIRTVVKLGREVSVENIKSLTLVDPEAPLVTTGSYGGQSIVQPVAGVYDFSEIKAYLKKHLSNDKALQEEAAIDVLNSSGIAGAASRKADKLTSAGLTVGVIGNAPPGTCGYICIYDVSGGKNPATLSKLEQMFGTTVVDKPLPAGVNSQSDFVILIGTDGAD